MPNEETKVCTARLPVALLADLKECAADQHRSVNSILWSAAEDYIRAWRAAQSQEHAETMEWSQRDSLRSRMLGLIRFRHGHGGVLTNGGAS
jgi:hypothetical protein